MDERTYQQQQQALAWFNQVDATNLIDTINKLRTEVFRHCIHHYTTYLISGRTTTQFTHIT
mgnify:CR=1 FL=1